MSCVSSIRCVGGKRWRTRAAGLRAGWLAALSLFMLGAGNGAAAEDRVTVVERGGVWWFRDGTGKEFVSLGVNHLAPALLRFAAAGGKEWADGGEAPSPELARIERDFQAWHFNTLGMHCDREFTAPLRERYFFVEPLTPVAFTGGAAYGRIRYEDPFTEEFERKIDRLAAARVPALAKSGHLLGYAFCDIPPWMVPDPALKQAPELGATHPWVRYLRTLPAESPGKRAWIGVLRRRHDTVAAVRAIYPTTARDWAALAATTEWPEAVDAAVGRADSETLMAEIAERYYDCHERAIRRDDPRAIVFGDKLNAYRIPDYLYPVLRRHVDVVLVQINNFFDRQRPTLEEIHRRTGKPILSGDSAFNLAGHPHQSNGIGTKLATWPEVGRAYRDYLRGLMSLPFMLGWHYCGYVETWDGQTTAPMQQSGFREPDGTERREVTEPASEANAQAEAWHRAAAGNE